MNIIINNKAPIFNNAGMEIKNVQNIILKDLALLTNLNNLAILNVLKTNAIFDITEVSADWLSILIVSTMNDVIDIITITKSNTFQGLRSRIDSVQLAL